ncbi:Ni/Fe hydrogenase subunit alpha [Rhodobacter capsulatus]|uniref:Ni/Fe hydrogenase subunit alpha n=1 Tax=Rhodobacter capsulatus TaxID=1061 RepID=UPI000411D610|nr:Ni/Fe hydrogenase subunit alpha [Rhodobacter capsulatus]
MLALETAPALRLPPIPVETVARPACPGPARGETAGQGRVTICLDARGQVRQVQLHLLDLCGVETLLEGRAIAEIPEAVQRLCGLCPVSHHLAAVKAMDRIAGYDRLTPTAEKLRRLMQYGQIVQSHAVQLYHLAEPDLLLGFDSEPARRGLVDVARAFPQLATEGVLMRRFGQEVVRAITGGRLRGAGAVPGGMRRPLPRAARDQLRADVDQVIDWAAGALRVLERLHGTNPAFYDHPAETGGNLLALVGASGAVDFYDGRLRARDSRGATLFDAVPAAAYRGVLAEPSGPGGPHLRALGPETGWYRVGPLARLQVCDLLTSEKAETERQRLLAPGDGKPLQGSVFHHGARLVELLHAAELIRDLLDDPELLGTDLMADRGAPQREAVGVIEAPRGTLLQRYEVDEAGRIRRCTLLLSTRNNSRAMDAALQGVAAQYCDGRRVTEDLLAHIEVAIRAFDPCLSCAAHALGQMPLSVELIDAGGAVVSGLRRGADGGVSCCVRS